MVHAILSDIHGNLEALEAVLEDLERVKPASVACLGDFVGYGASPNECIERLRPRLAEAVVGNHDLAAVGRLALNGFHADAAVAARWTDGALTPENRAYLESLPLERIWHGARLTHAAPAAPASWRYVLSARDAKVELAAFGERVCFIGHTHFPCTFERDAAELRYSRAEAFPLEPGHRYLVTVGSVGQPRDGDPRAAYLLYDDEAGLVRHVRREYDVAGAMRRIVEAGLPSFLADRLQWGE
ncbi:MAG TPA: metallophosphoesterase family protein [Candidatus Eisenbacteria bacterium]|jgi:diadenosine tetraphosphatase ApaH/serine/threonine PP2A family protein phosphatase